MRSPFRVVAERRSIWSRVTAAALISLGLVATATAAQADGAAIGGPQLSQPGEVVNMAPWLPPLPAVTATSFVVADADTGDVLAAKNAHQKLAPASTLKTLTALTLIPRLQPSVKTIAGRDAPSVDGTKAGIVAGTTYSADDLFIAMLMMSANDAAVALADANGGLDVTLAQMNAQAAHLQAHDTVAKTPNGLDAPGQSSSAYDLALFFRAGLDNARFRHYLALQRASFPAPGGKTFQIQTHDRLLTRYPGMVGGKNGYTVAAKASYVGAATRDGHTIIVSVMRDVPNFWGEVQALLDWGFAADANIMPVGVLVGPAQATPSPTPRAASAPSAASSAAAGAAEPTEAGEAAGAIGAAGAGGTAAAGGSERSSALSVGSVMIWGAVSAGGLIFLLALAQGAARRRRRRERDDRYLAGLSRLSALEQVSDRG